MNKRFITILKGGLIATSAMTILMLIAPMMGMPKMLIGKMLAGFMHLPVGIGWFLHFVIGTILATMFVLVWKKRLPGRAAAKGMLFSLIPFSVAQTVVMPLLGTGFFFINTPAPVSMFISSLVGHLVYGAVLGLVTRQSKGLEIK